MACRLIRGLPTTFGLHKSEKMRPITDSHSQPHNLSPPFCSSHTLSNAAQASSTITSNRSTLLCPLAFCLCVCVCVCVCVWGGRVDRVFLFAGESGFLRGRFCLPAHLPASLAQPFWGWGAGRNRRMVGAGITHGKEKRGTQGKEQPFN